MILNFTFDENNDTIINAARINDYIDKIMLYAFDCDLIKTIKVESLNVFHWNSKIIISMLFISSAPFDKSTINDIEYELTEYMYN